MAPERGNKGSRKAAAPVTRPQRVAAQERVAKALELRKAGASYAVIAAQCGYKTPQHAHKAVKAAILALPRDNAIEARKFESERLDRLMLAYWKKALDGDQHAADYVLRVMKRRATLLGLDTPPAPAGETGGFDRAFREFMTSYARGDERTRPEGGD